MKKILYILIALSLGFASCSQEFGVQQDSADCIRLKVFNSPMTTRAVDAGVAYEQQLNRLDCFFYVKGATDQPCVYYQKVDLNKVAQAEIPFYVDESVINTIFPNSNQTCDVLVLANLPDGTYAKGQTGTDIESLYSRVLELGNGYDAIDQPFVMVGFDEATKSNTNNASGTIMLTRLASKITIRVNIPEKIVFDNEGVDDVVMLPVFKDDQNKVTLKSSFNNGATKTNLNATHLVDVETELFSTEKVGYVFSQEIPATSTDPMKYQYTCEIPFYSYARAWDKGAENAAYFTLELPWVNETSKVTQTYYYQILINAAGRCFEPNRWYDLTVNVGVLGSTVESKPTPIQDLTYYVLDWTTEPDSDQFENGGDRYENVVIQNYTYFQIAENHIVMNNTTTGHLSFSASHNIKWALEWPTDEAILETLDPLETTYNKDKKYHSYYINSGTTPVAVSLAGYITANNFSLDADKRNLIFTYPSDNIADNLNVYSPVFVHLKVWLDIDGAGNAPNGIEENFVEYITFTYYPPMYIVPDLSNPYSIYVNNRQHNDQNTDYTFRAGSTTHNLGHIPGVSGSWGTKDSYMYTVTVSSFKSDNTFKAHDGNNYPYIIGDPRQRESDLELDDDNQSNVASNWASANAVAVDDKGNVVKNANGELQYTQRTLQYYYPTAKDGNAFQIVSPKFKIVSFHSSGWGNITSKGADMRCATFQEDGYPAGRWRLPTEAEIMFIIDLQKAEVISDIFYGGSEYYAATEVNSTTRYKISYPTNGTPKWNSGTTGSVRCVYDEWYWGSEREAKRNPDYNPNYNNGGLDNNANHANNEYLFTWGDKQIW